VVVMMMFCCEGAFIEEVERVLSSKRVGRTVHYQVED